MVDLFFRTGGPPGPEYTQTVNPPQQSSVGIIVAPPKEIITMRLLYSSLIKTRIYPITPCDAADGFLCKIVDRIAQAIHDLLKRSENLVMKAPGT